jgi:hypothetical protein
MNIKQLQERIGTHSIRERPKGHVHFWERTLSRRHFLRATAGAAGLVLGSSLITPALAAAASDPRAIPGGLDLLGTGEIFHLFLPDAAHPNDDPSTITDFNGFVGLAYLAGMGTQTNLDTGETRHLPYMVDLRFMKGEYIGVDGKHHHGAFVLT